MFTSTLLIAAPFSLGALAQSSSSTLPRASTSSDNSAPAATTLNLFLDSEPDQAFVGSIIAADACETTVALVCTEGDYGFGQFSMSCDGSGVAHATYRGSTEFGMSTASETATLGYDAEVTVTETCSLAPSSSAVCSVLLSASVEDNGKSKTKSTITYDGDVATAKWFQVPITAGAEKLPAAGATCTANGNAAAATGLSDLYKVVIVPGAAALLAGAAAL